MGACCATPKAKPYGPYGKTVTAKVINVHDGDTVTIEFRMFGDLWTTNLRLTGIDAPEVHPSRSSPLYVLHKSAGEKVRDILQRIVAGKEVTVKFGPTPDKYGGRYQGELFINGESVARTLLKAGLVKEYGGTQARGWTQQELLEIEKRVMNNDTKRRNTRAP